MMRAGDHDARPDTRLNYIYHKKWCKMKMTRSTSVQWLLAYRLSTLMRADAGKCPLYTSALAFKESNKTTDLAILPFAQPSRTYYSVIKTGKFVCTRKIKQSHIELKQRIFSRYCVAIAIATGKLSHLSSIHLAAFVFVIMMGGVVNARRR